MDDASELDLHHGGVAVAPVTREKVVLLIEDNEDVAAMLMHVFRAINLKVAWYSLGCEALAEVDRLSGSLALVLSDCRLPDADGRLICHEIHERCPTLPIIVTSGNMRNHSLSPLTPSESVVFLPKPYTPTELIRLSTQLLKHTPRMEHRVGLSSAR